MNNLFCPIHTFNKCHKLNWLPSSCQGGKDSKEARATFPRESPTVGITGPRPAPDLGQLWIQH